MKGDIQVDIRVNILSLEVQLGYTFKNKLILWEALSHSSYSNEQGFPSNERLEFLGDAVLHLILTEHIMGLYPKANEGELSFLRSCMESEDFLFKAAQKLNIGSFILLGKGEELSGGREKRAILADAMEAVIAAVSVDGGFSAAREMVLLKFKDLLEQTYETAFHSDSKSELQHIAQQRYGCLPTYAIAEEKGLDHDKTFVAVVKIVTEKGEISAEGSGKNKKSAEKAAACNMLKKAL
ncbi:MAG: ribonuclease III [Deferribacteraceae bacterium]|jgi:ribonuclease-3|nr:ribonuclease III [Deferribacteraceae bacterium]